MLEGLGDKKNSLDIFFSTHVVKPVAEVKIAAAHIATLRVAMPFCFSTVVFSSFVVTAFFSGCCLVCLSVAAARCARACQGKRSEGRVLLDTFAICVCTSSSSPLPFPFACVI